MTEITDNELLTLNKRGIIPGPNETESDFLKRANYCLTLKDNFAKEVKEIAPTLQASNKNTDNAIAKVKSIFGFSPGWVPISISSYRLSPWHGGCAWIYQKSKSEPPGAFLQISPKFQKSKKFFGIYNFDEIVAHEYCHIGRMTFQEPKFEEFLSYSVFKSPLRKFLGPIIQSFWEALLFIFSLFIVLFLDLYLVFMNLGDLYLDFMWLKIFPASLILFALIRLIYRHNKLNSCIKALTNFFQDQQKANAFLFRLTDREIYSFGKMSKSEFLNHIDREKKKSIRLRLLSLI